MNALKERPATMGGAQQDSYTIPLGAQLLDDVSEYIGRFVAFPSEHALTAVSLWAIHAHAIDLFDATPRLALLSPEPGSGKTRTLEVLDLLVPQPMHALSVSAPAIFRSIATERPTLLADEVDSIFGRRGKDDSAEDVRALLNAGHRRGARIPRCVGPTHDVRMFDAYAAVALAGLGDLPDTLMSRSVIIRMRKRAPNEYIEPFRYRIAAPAGHELRERIAAWVLTVSDDLATFPAMPPGVTDRPADCWEALLAVADAAGGRWPITAREACVELCRVASSREASLGVRLLADTKTIFGEEDRLSTETILKRLHELEESPWNDLRGHPLDARGLARRLSAYGIASTKVKILEASLRGYRREDLHDAWVRYLTPESPEPTEPTEPRRLEGVAQVPLGIEVPEPAAKAEPNTPHLTSTVPQVPEVPQSDGWAAGSDELEAEGRRASEELRHAFAATVSRPLPARATR